MHDRDSIRSIQQITSNNRVDLPETPGVYAFWWIGDRQQLLGSNRHVVLKGPNEQRVDVEYREWWPEELIYPCLYVGKSTNIKKRFSLHINHKATPNTTSCQLRWGIEHIFPNDNNPLRLINTSVGFSYRDDFGDNAIAERFFEEDRLVGIWRPWFNIDSER